MCYYQTFGRKLAFYLLLREGNWHAVGKSRPRETSAEPRRLFLRIRRQIKCFEDRHKSISADVAELTIETPTDPTLFDAPKGAIELGRCVGKTVPPAPPSLPVLPPGLRLEFDRRIRLWLVVDTKGRPQYLKVLPPARKDSNESVLNWVQHWNFTPGTCDGTPIPMEMTVDVPAAAR